ncbi:MAG: hypothetical protein IIT94_06170, partial [Prevotella sp.]|nr:hypothetical protein [Prevotella sp.]
GVPVVIVAVVLLVVQQRQSRRLQEDLKQLSKIKRHTIEYELVLKTMKLCVWRIDVPSKTVTFESDYRDSFDTVVIPPETGLDVLSETIAPAYVDNINKNMKDLLEGKIEHTTCNMR